MTPPALQQMIQALGLEIAAIRKRGGSQQILLRGGVRTGEVEGGFLYQFPFSEEKSLRDETPVRIVVGQDEANGTVVSLKEGVLVVSLDKDLGPRAASAKLVADDSFLVERLKEKLDKVASGEGRFDRASADRVIGLGKIRSQAAPVPRECLGGLNPPNSEQREAIARSLGSDVTFVWGPPGTGKTATVARIVEGHYRAGRSVLLVSNTNIAVDTALEMIAERLQGDPGFQAGAALRLGPIAKEELRRRFGPQVVLEEIVARLGAALAREKTEVQRKALELEKAAAFLRLAAKELESLRELRQNLQKAQGAVAGHRVDVQRREREAEQAQGRLARLCADLAKAQTMGAIRRFLTGLKPERLEKQILATELELTALGAAKRALEAELGAFEDVVRTRATAVRQKEDEVKTYPPIEKCRAQLASLDAQLEQGKERINELDRKMAGLQKEVLERCRILATTVYRTYLGNQLNRGFDVVVIDEASMLMLPMAYYAAGLAKHSVTVAGDFRQLPSIVMADDPLAEEWLRKDVFEKSGIPGLLEAGKAPPHLVALCWQYRMREEICEVVNRPFYQGLLRTGTKDSSSSRFPFGDSPLFYIDTGPIQPWVALRLGGYSRYNLLHALLIRNIVLHLDAEGFLPRGSSADGAVGVTAPYSAQTRLIQSLLEEKLGERVAGVAATVHRFQGNEKVAMVVDFTDSIGLPWLGRFMRATDLGDDGAKLLNVAFTRAKRHLTLVANFDYLKRKAPRGAFVLDVLERFERHGVRLNPVSFLSVGAADLAKGLDILAGPRFQYDHGASGFFSEGTFYPVFSQDLRQARSSVLIFSPFLTGRGTSRWVEYLREAVHRGARVRIVTKPPQEFGGGTEAEVAETVARLSELGVTVDYRAKVHEKLAIIDGAVGWHGSLNILSHNDTSESMIRVASRSFCEELAKFIRTPGRKGEDGDPATPENPACSKCGGPTCWVHGKNGIFFECAGRCGGTCDPRRKTGNGPGGASRPRVTGRVTSGASRSGKPCPAAGCSGQLVNRNGRYGVFLGCTKYPQCHHTEKVH
ncbi:MAG: AAA domain-containing protein [Deferrisomatales bacterium]